MVNETVLGRGVLGLERTEERLLGTEDLHGRGRVLGERHQAAGVCDETSTDQLADQHRQVGRDGVHAVLEVLEQLRAIGVHLDNLVAESRNVVQVILADLW